MRRLLKFGKKINWENIMKSSQVIGVIVALGFSLPVMAQNSVVRSSKFIEQKAVTISSKVAAVYKKPIESVAKVPTVMAIKPSDNIKVYSPVIDNVTQVIVDGNKPTSPPVVYDGPYTFYPNTGAVDFDLHKGLLKPQVIELIMHHSLIDSLDDIEWQASDNFMWPNSHKLSGVSLDHVINAVLKPYKLVANFKGNGSVIIKKL